MPWKNDTPEPDPRPLELYRLDLDGNFSIRLERETREKAYIAMGTMTTISHHGVDRGASGAKYDALLHVREKLRLALDAVSREMEQHGCVEVNQAGPMRKGGEHG